MAITNNCSSLAFCYVCITVTACIYFTGFIYTVKHAYSQVPRTNNFDYRSYKLYNNYNTL